MSGSTLATALAVGAGVAGAAQVAVMSRLHWPRLLGIVLLAVGAALSLRK